MLQNTPDTANCIGLYISYSTYCLTNYEIRNMHLKYANYQDISTGKVHPQTVLWIMSINNPTASSKSQLKNELNMTLNNSDK